MTSIDLQTFFEDRYREIEEYLALLEALDEATRSGVPKIFGTESRISVAQQKILYSSMYLQLYNLVEATVSRCIDSISEAAADGSRWKPADLNDRLRQEWIRSTARTHLDQAPDKRLKSAMEMCEHIIQQLPLQNFDIEKGGGGNWDDESIYAISQRLGCKLQISAATRRVVKRQFRDGLGALKLVKERRNTLAHGSASFTECADGIVAGDLRELADAVSRYLREVISCFAAFVDAFEFLQPSRKPSGTP